MFKEHNRRTLEFRCRRRIYGSVYFLSCSAMNSTFYQKQCLSHPIIPSITLGSLFAGVSVLQGARLTPNLVAVNIGGIYCYSILQCPMEAIHGRQSALHNALAGAMLGYVGVSRGFLGIPFVDNYFLYRYPQLSPAVTGAVVYGGVGLALATILGNKPI